MKCKVFILILCSFFVQTAQAGLEPVELACEYRKGMPLVDILQPRLSWINRAGEGDRGQKQTAWQVRVATSENMLSRADLWDSGKIASDQNSQIVYDGKKLQSRMECWWQVRVWDRDGSVSEWSEPASWRMGILESSEWKGEWIGAPWQGEEALPKPSNPGASLENSPPPAPMFRKSFHVQKPISKAVAFVTGMGYFEFYVNGEKMGEDVLVPNQTNYGKRPELIHAPIPLDDNFMDCKVMYLAYDITGRMSQGENVLGSILGNGFYNPSKFWALGYGSPRFFGQVHITYADGTEDVWTSDSTWKVSKSPILMDMVYYGEHYDARLEQPGWCMPGFNDSAWVPAVKRKAPEGRLVAHTAPTDKVTLRLAPRSIEKTGEGEYRVDFGVEISGWLRLNRVQGPAGRKVNIRYVSNTYSGDNSYVFRGGAPESYAARFNWFVFNGVEITGWPGDLKPEHLTAEAVNTAVEETGRFETSNPLFNAIDAAWKRSQLDNMHGGIVSDCPHRERSGYTGDGQVACVTVMHHFDVRAFYTKWIQDMLDAQNPVTGYVPNGAPWQPGCGGGVGWGAAIAIMPWEFYLHYGDKDMLQRNYEGMKGYVRYLEQWMDDTGVVFSKRAGKDGEPLRWFNLGEWAAPGPTVPDEMVHTFYFWRCVDLTARTAAVLNLPEEAALYKVLAEKTRKAFHRKFYDAELGTYGKGGGNIFALRMGVPSEQYRKVTASLRADILANGGHLDTGIFGTQFFFEVLSENGMHDLACEAINKRTAPGYGFGIEQGATTTWEHWDGKSSQNHPMFGGGLSWFYRKLAGMNVDPDRPGYRHIIFKPQPMEGLDSVSYYNQTVLGEAGISWENRKEYFSMDITIPVGSIATVYIPSGNIGGLTEQNLPIGRTAHLKILSVSKDCIMLEVLSGEYHFQVRHIPDTPGTPGSLAQKN